MATRSPTPTSVSELRELITCGGGGGERARGGSEEGKREGLRHEKKENVTVNFELWSILSSCTLIVLLCTVAGWRMVSN